jgi:hypothetical protein
MAALLFGGACVWRAFRGTLSDSLRLAVLLAAMVLGAPHVGDYDALLLGIAAMLVLTDGFTRPFRRGEAALAAAIWISTAFEPPFVFHLAVIVPAIVAAFMLRLVWTPDGAAARGGQSGLTFPVQSGTVLADGDNDARPGL